MGRGYLWAGTLPSGVSFNDKHDGTATLSGTPTAGGTFPLTITAANGVTPGQFVIEPATLICLGFEWDITGDDNRNATVTVSYRV